MNKRSNSLAMAAALALVGCATAPLAPRVAVMPVPGKPFDVFVAEERDCRQYAEQSVGGQVEGVDNAAVNTAVIGTIIGAVAGAAIGGRSGAAVGAGSGLIIGSAAGTGRTDGGERDIQRRYDIAYQQCMYAKGNQLPGSQYVQSARASAYPPPPPSSNPPPPPAAKLPPPLPPPPPRQ